MMVVVVGQSVRILLSSHWVVSEDATMLLPGKGANMCVFVWGGGGGFTVYVCKILKVGWVEICAVEAEGKEANFIHWGFCRRTSSRQ